MGKLEPSLVGNVSGRVGEVVFYKRMGQIFVRKYVPKVHDARSEEQLRQRSVFKAMQRLSANMMLVLQKSMRNTARQQGLLASNLFLRLNAACCTVQDGHTVVDYSRLQVAAGPCPKLMPKRAKMTGMRFELRFHGHTEYNIMRGDDMVCVYAYCPELEEGYEAMPTLRCGKRMAFVLPERMRGHEVYFYAYCLDYSQELTSSDSVVVGHFVAGEDNTVDFEETSTNIGDTKDATALYTTNTYATHTEPVAQNGVNNSVEERARDATTSRKGRSE